MKTVLLLLLLSPVVGWAQSVNVTPDDLQRKQSYLLMRDGAVVRGQILRQDSTLITVRQRNGELTFVEADQLVRIMAIRPENIPVNVVQVRPVGPNRVFVLKDGSQVEGRFVRRDCAMITVRQRNGQLTYFESELLVRMDSVVVETFTDASRTFPNRFPPWLLTGQTAYNPEKGRFYYRNTWLLLNEFQYGITRYWSVGASCVAPIPLLIGTDKYLGTGRYILDNSQLFTKLSAPVGNRLRLGVNASYRSSRQFAFSGGWGIWTVQALASTGNSQRNVTFGYGRQGQGSQASKRYSFYRRTPNQSFLTLGVMQKLAPGLTFISDNTLHLGQTYYYYTGSKASVSAALRIDRRRHAFDLGVWTLVYQRPYVWDGRPARFVPYVGYNLLIGRD